MKIQVLGTQVLLYIFPILLIGQVGSKPIITEASGIFKEDNLLYIVSDNTAGKYFTYDISGLKLGISTTLDDQKRIKEHDLKLGPISLDLEGLVVLNGKVLTISERTRTLLSYGRVIKTFSKKFTEFSNRGLEGLASRLLFEDCQIYEFASLWEGGYPAVNDISIGLVASDVKNSMAPVIVTNTYDSNFQLGQSRIIELNMSLVNNWVDEKMKDGEEPYANRYRAPDLVWYQGGFIVLLSSERSIPKDSKDKNRYKSKLLQRFDINGQSIKGPFDLNTELGDLSKLNWEGMTWNEYGKSLLLINDDDKKNPIVVMLELPKKWQ